MLQITECFVGSTKSAPFTSANFTHCGLKLASFGNLCIAWPVLFESLQNWTTQRFTNMKMWRFFKRNHVTMRLFHNVFKRDIWLQVTKSPPVTSFARLRNSRWPMLRTLKRFFNIKTGQSEQKIHRFGTCHVCTKRLWGPLNSIFWVYMPFNPRSPPITPDHPRSPLHLCFVPADWAHEERGGGKR